MHFCLSRRYQSDILAHHVINDLLWLLGPAIHHSNASPCLWDCRQCASAESRTMWLNATPHLCVRMWGNSTYLKSLPEWSGAEGRDFTFEPPAAETPEPDWSLSFPVAWVLLSAGTMMPKSFGVQMLQQLFELEVCMRETKNRTRTPLSQLPLHCLWDCLRVSPLSSFSPLARLPLTQWLLLPRLCFPIFLLSPWIRPCVCGQSCAGMKDLKQDTASPHYGPLANLMGN